MAYWDWNSSYELGIETIDNQHKRIVEYINELHAIQGSNDRAKTYAVLIGITEYTISHFAYEEDLMREAGYESLGEHKKYHENFIQDIVGYKVAFNQGHDILNELLAELQQWLTNHILHEDKKYQGDITKTLKNKNRADNIDKKKPFYKLLFN